MKLVILLLAAVFLAGCAGSPRITIEKNVSIENSCHVVVGYSTESSTTSDADIVQELKDLLAIPPPKPGG